MMKLMIIFIFNANRDYHLINIDTLPLFSQNNVIKELNIPNILFFTIYT